MFKFDLLQNEKVVNIYRQTEAVLFKPAIIVFVLIYGPWYFLLRYDLASSYLRLLFFWTILVFIYAAHRYFLWLLNVYILTNKRLIKVSYKSVFNKEVLESPLDRVLNISYFVKGFWPALFGFGSVEVQVAGLSEPVVLKNISSPAQVKDFLWNAHSKYSGSTFYQTGPELAHESIVRKPRDLK